MSERWSRRLTELMKEKKIGKDHIVILLLAGVLLLVIAMPSGKGKETSETDSRAGLLSSASEDQSMAAAEEDAYVARTERKLSELLSQMDGAGEVSVMITLSSSAERIVEKDREADSETVTEKDSQGGSRSTKNEALRESAIYGDDSGGGQTPYVSKELTPEVEGVVVVSPGADNAVVVKNITEAVQALFGIDTHKIRIVKGRRAEQ